MSITLFRSIILFCGTDNILWNIQTKCGGTFCKILSVPHNTTMDLKNVMSLEVLISKLKTTHEHNNTKAEFGGKLSRF